ncbi:MAG: ABC transporter substrate-binding protein [Sedimentisphaerales bacterium]|nr:ABC transporter substrate-binding protein [Sedimentisphaerales bacterium]
MRINKEIDFRWQIPLVTILVVLTAFWGSCGKKTQKVYCVGIVSGAEAFADIADGFKAKMTELGYIEGRNIIYDFHKLNDNPAEEQRIAEKFVADKVDLIFAFPTEPAVAAKKAAQGTNIPVVFALAGIEGSNLVESILKPGGNITGVRFPGPEITAKRLEILHELMPKAESVYLIYDPDYPNASPALNSLRSTASPLGIKFVEDPVINVNEIQTVLQKRASSNHIGIDAIFIMPEMLTQTPEGFELIITFANEHKIPVAGGVPYTAQNGALFSMSSDNIEMGELAATLADKIFKGAPAGSIMVITPPAHLWLNYKAAQQLGLIVPEGLLSRADEIIR